MRRRAPWAGLARGLVRTEAEMRMGGMANTFQTRRVLMENLECVLRSYA